MQFLILRLLFILGALKGVCPAAEFVPFAPPCYPEFETEEQFTAYCRAYVHDAPLIYSKMTDDFFIAVFFWPPRACAVLDMPRRLKPPSAWSRRPSVGGRYYDLTGAQSVPLKRKRGALPPQVQISVSSEMRTQQGGLGGYNYMLGTYFQVEDSVRKVGIQFEDQSSTLAPSETTTNSIAFELPKKEAYNYRKDRAIAEAGFADMISERDWMLYLGAGLGSAVTLICGMVIRRNGRQRSV